MTFRPDECWSPIERLQYIAVAEVTFTAPDHLTVQLSDGRLLDVYAPIGGVVTIRFHDVHYTLTTMVSDRIERLVWANEARMLTADLDKANAENAMLRAEKRARRDVMKLPPTPDMYPKDPNSEGNP